MRSETNANEIKIKKATQQDMEERILYIVPLGNYSAKGHGGVSSLK